MLGSAAFTAFGLGLISACSLPLGTLATGFWKPRDRTLAVLMAFGGGALLAALTIDLVGAALERGHFWSLAAGAVTGGMLFMALNQAVNTRGGFLRKSSTTIYYLRRERRKRFRRLLAHIGRIPELRGLPAEDAEALAKAAFSQLYGAGTTLYRRRDPCDRLYIIESGQVELLDPQRNMQPFERLGRHDAFGRMAFFTGSPHATIAVTRTDTRVWVLPREAFDRVLVTSVPLARAMQKLLGGEEIARYLRERQGMQADAVAAWVERAVQQIGARGTMEPAVRERRPTDQLADRLPRTSRLPIFQALPPQDLRTIAAHMFRKQHERGDTLFHPQESAERLYVIEQGEVALIDPQNRVQRPAKVRDGEAFGGLSFLSGSGHTVSAVATTELTVWVLLKRDFDKLLAELPSLEQQVSQFLRRGELTDYLNRKQHFDPDAASRWLRKATKSIEAGGLIPAAGEMAAAMGAHKSAPLAIWLGMSLDGIPESLVIGTNVIESHLSYSLIAALFLSNFPESLSSSVGMRHQGMPFRQVLGMWSSIMVLTGIGAAAGCLLLSGAPPALFSLLEGMAAGAMLTMIAETMLPEAYFKGGSVVGMSTLLGFLAAIFFKTLE